MSYTVIITIEKTSQSPENAFDSMPMLPNMITPQQLQAFQEAYPSQWSIDHNDPNKIVTTSVFDSKAIWEAQILDPISTLIKTARNSWAATNHVNISVQYI
jgi:hypothetical protein